MHLCFLPNEIGQAKLAQTSECHEDFPGHKPIQSANVFDFLVYYLLTSKPTDET